MKKWVIANFKLFKTIEETSAYAKKFKPLVTNSKNNIAVCPSFVSLESMARLFKGTKVLVGAQNCAKIAEGAQTGEVSAKMIKSAGAKLVIVGHSERRNIFAETDEIVNEKIKLALIEGLTVVVCLADDGSKGFEKNIKKQLETLLDGVEDVSKLIIAFEPVWAIGTGKTMATKDIEIVVRYIKEIAKKITGKTLDVLYGGSVNANNAKEFLELDAVDGLLIGGASKDPITFAQICNM